MHCRKLTVVLCFSQVVSGCPTAHMDGKLAAKATGCFSVCRLNRSDLHFTRVSYNCAFCPSTFKWKRALKDHISAVHEGKSFACTQCRYTFVNKSGLNEHVKHYHEQLPRYRCEQCGKGYANRSHFFGHLATHVGGE